MGRTLPTAPTNWPTSTRLPDHWTSSQDGARRPAFVTIVRSQRPVTAGRTGSWATRGIDSRHVVTRSEEHTSELQSRLHLVCRLLLEKKKKNTHKHDARNDEYHNTSSCADRLSPM